MGYVQRTTAAILLASGLLVAGCGGGSDPVPAAGDLINSSPAQASSVTGATSTLKLRYRMTAVTGGLTEANALLFAPAGTPPAGGWPLVVWAHGTTGVSDGCAPSRDFNLTDPPFVSGLLAAGFAVLAPDYEGLDAPGVLPYYIRSSHANSVLHAVKAAQAVKGVTLSKAWSVVGHSQGGNVALAAAQFADQLGPDLPLTAVAALAPGSDLGLSSDLAFGEVDRLLKLGDIDRAAEILFYLQYNGGFVVQGMRTVNPALDVSKIFGVRMLPLLDLALTDPDCTQFRSALLADLTAYFQAGGDLGSYPGVRRDWSAISEVKALLEANRVGQVRLTAPVLLVQGSADTQVPAAVTQALAQTLLAKGSKVTLRDVPGGTHDSITVSHLAEVIAFLKAPSY
jgi:acetyl esterase/lipase